MDKVVIHVTILGTVIDKSVGGGTKVENCLMGIVKENSISPLIVNTKIKGNTHVQRIVTDSVCEVIRIPVGVGFAKSVEVTGPFLPDDFDSS